MNTLDLLFSWFLTATVRGALLALAVLALRAALRGRLPARWRYALWLPMIFVLVAPNLPQSRWSLENRFARSTAPVPRAAPLSDPDFVVPLEVAEPPVSVRKAAPAIDRRQLWALGWLAGCIGTFVFVLTGYARTMRRIRRNAVDAEPGLQRILTEAARAGGLRRLPRFLVSTEVRSPAVTGFFRPTLLLPADFPCAFTENEAALILQHELTHLKRLDLPQNWLFGLLQALHWCNPILWFAFNRIRDDREAACDAAVLTAAHGDQRAEYGHALLKLEGSLARSGLSLGFVGIFERSSGMRARVRAIAAHRPSHPAWSVLGAVLLLVLALVGATRAQNGVKTDAQPEVSAAGNESNPSPKLEEIKRKLRETIIPKIMSSETPIRDVLDQLAKSSVALDPAHTGVRFLTNKAPAANLATPLTISLSNVPLGEALRYIAALANLRITVEDDGVHFRSLDVQPEEYVTREWPWNAETEAALGYTAGMDLKECLVTNGVPFPSGAAGRLSSDGNELIVKNTQESVDLLEQIIHPRPPSPNEFNASANRGAITSQVSLTSEASLVKKKLKAIIIPHFELRNATLHEALEILSKASADLDPAKQGVNFVMRLDAPSSSEAGSAPASAPLTLSLNNVPLLEALKYTTNLSGTKFKIEDYAVEVVPLSFSVEDFITRQWIVPPELFSVRGDKTTANKPAADQAKDFLTAQGVPFPPGASAIYLERAQKLIVKNTPDILDIVDAMVRGQITKEKIKASPKSTTRGAHLDEN